MDDIINSFGNLNLEENAAGDSGLPAPTDPAAPLVGAVSLPISPEDHEPQRGSAEEKAYQPIDMGFGAVKTRAVGGEKASFRSGEILYSVDGTRKDWLLHEQQHLTELSQIRARILPDEETQAVAPPPKKEPLVLTHGRYEIKVTEVTGDESAPSGVDEQVQEARVLDTISGDVRPRQPDQLAARQLKEERTRRREENGLNDYTDGVRLLFLTEEKIEQLVQDANRGVREVKSQIEMRAAQKKSRGAIRRAAARAAKEAETLPESDPTYDMSCRDLAVYTPPVMPPTPLRRWKSNDNIMRVPTPTTPENAMGRRFEDKDGGKQVLLTGTPHVIGCPVFEYAYSKMGLLPLMSSRRYKGRWMDWGCHMFTRTNTCMCHQVVRIKPGTENKPWATFETIPGKKTDSGESYNMICMRYIWLIPLAGPVGLTDFVPTCSCVTPGVFCWHHSHRHWWHHRGKLVPLPISVDGRGEKADYSTFDEAQLHVAYGNWVVRQTGKPPVANATRIQMELEAKKTHVAVPPETRVQMVARRRKPVGSIQQMYATTTPGSEERKEQSSRFGLHSIDAPGVLKYKMDAASVNVIPNVWGQTQAIYNAYPLITGVPAAAGAHGIRLISRVSACNGIDPPLSDVINLDYTFEAVPAIDYDFHVYWETVQLLDQLKIVSISGYITQNNDPVPSSISGVLAGKGAFNDKMGKAISYLLLTSRVVVDNSALYAALYIIWYENWVFETVGAAKIPRAVNIDYEERETNPDPANVNVIMADMQRDLERRCFVFVGDEVCENERDIMRYLAIDGPCYNPPAAPGVPLQISHIVTPPIPMRWYHRGVVAPAAMPALGPVDSEAVLMFMRKISVLRGEQIDMVRGVTKAAALVFTQIRDFWLPAAAAGVAPVQQNTLMTPSLETGATLWAMPMDSNWMWRQLGANYVAPDRDRWADEWTTLTSMDGQTLVNVSAMWAASISTSMSTVFNYFNFTGAILTRVATRQVGAWNHAAPYIRDIIGRDKGAIVPQIWQMACWLLNQFSPINASPSCWLGGAWCAAFARIPDVAPLVAGNMSLWSWRGMWLIPYLVDPLNVLFVITTFIETWGYVGPGTSFNAYQEVTQGMAPAGLNRWWSWSGSAEYKERLDRTDGGGMVHVSYANLWYNAFSQYFRVPVAGVAVQGSRWFKYQKSGAAVRGDDVNYPQLGAYIAVFNLAAGQFPTYDWHNRQILAPTIAQGAMPAADWTTLCQTADIKLLNGGITMNVAPVPFITAFNMASMSSIMATPSLVGGRDANFIGALAYKPTLTNTTTPAPAAATQQQSTQPGNAPGQGSVPP